MVASSLAAAEFGAGKRRERPLLSRQTRARPDARNWPDRELKWKRTPNSRNCPSRLGEICCRSATSKLSFGRHFAADKLMLVAASPLAGHNAETSPMSCTFGPFQRILF